MSRQPSLLVHVRIRNTAYGVVAGHHSPIDLGEIMPLYPTLRDGYLVPADWEARLYVYIATIKPGWTYQWSTLLSRRL